MFISKWNFPVVFILLFNCKELDIVLRKSNNAIAVSSKEKFNAKIGIYAQYAFLYGKKW